jgi:amidase
MDTDTANTTNLAFASARHLAGLIRKREIGCLELLDFMIARVERLDPKINAVVVRDFDRARDRAKRLDTVKDPLGRLHGVPMTVKESFDVAGLPTTWGDPAKCRAIAAEDAVLVRRLSDAGANVFGKTNVPLMLGDWQSFNAVYGSTSNPWDLERTPGGSSGGGAAALCAGLTGLESGSDIGGSIRQPAHNCGLFGHKPTWGLVPLYGHAPMPNVASTTDISCVGPLARSADDLLIALEAVAGPDTAETELAIELPAPRVKHLKGLRVAVWAEDAASPTDPEITAALLDLAAHLEKEGATVSTTARPAIDPRTAYHVFLKLLTAALSSRADRATLDRIAARAATYAADDESTVAVLARGADIRHGEWLILNERRHRMRRAWGAFFQDYDVLLCPVLALPAQPKRETQPTHEMTVEVNGQTIQWNEMMFWPGLIGGYHLPSSVAPLGLTRGGLPMGVQIVGPLYGDRMTIAVAKMLEQSWRAFVPPPGWE